MRLLLFLACLSFALAGRGEQVNGCDPTESKLNFLSMCKVSMDYSASTKGGSDARCQCIVDKFPVGLPQLTDSKNGCTFSKQGIYNIVNNHVVELKCQ